MNITPMLAALLASDLPVSFDESGGKMTPEMRAEREAERIARAPKALAKAEAKRKRKAGLRLTRGTP